jgi:hypothetical protein
MPSGNNSLVHYDILSVIQMLEADIEEHIMRRRDSSLKPNHSYTTPLKRKINALQKVLEVWDVAYKMFPGPAATDQTLNYGWTPSMVKDWDQLMKFERTEALVELARREKANRKGGENNGQKG